MRRTTIIGLLSLALLPVATPAQAQSKLRLYANGSYAPSSVSFSETLKFTEFAEEGSLEAQLKVKSGFGGDAGLDYYFSKNLGVRLGISLASRDASGSYTADLPHPLYLNQPRRVSGEVTGLSYKETAPYLDVVYRGSSGSLDVLLFGGASLIKVEAELLQRVQYTQTYPYDTVTVTSTPAVARSDSPFGFNVGGGLDYRFSHSVGLGVQAGYSRATAKLVPAEGSSAIEIKAGGFQVAAGLRVFF